MPVWKDKRVLPRRVFPQGYAHSSNWNDKGVNMVIRRTSLDDSFNYGNTSNRNRVVGFTTDTATCERCGDVMKGAIDGSHLTHQQRSKQFGDAFGNEMLRGNAYGTDHRRIRPRSNEIWDGPI